MAPRMVYQFKLVLRDIKPKIWRRIQVREESNFYSLHVAIQDAMSWKDYHLHEFEIYNDRTGKMVLITMPDESGFFHDRETKPGPSVLIGEYFVNTNDMATYKYDFGDGWEVDVVFENNFPAKFGKMYPICLDGRLAGPPEDCGGPNGYNNLRMVLINPNHNKFAEVKQWLKETQYPNYRASEFDPKSVRFDNPKERYKVAFMEPKMKICQFKITLKGNKPKIWRRIQIREECNFWDLHVAIQNAMGWRNSHDHQFEIYDLLLGIGENANVKRGKSSLLRHFFTHIDFKVFYLYDLRDKWLHEVVLEKVLPAKAGQMYPICLDGRMACPPEESGGVSGYRHLNDIIGNPFHYQYLDCMKWLMKTDYFNFDPMEFDVKSIKFDDPEECWKHN